MSTGALTSISKAQAFEAGVLALLERYENMEPLSPVIRDGILDYVRKGFFTLPRHLIDENTRIPVIEYDALVALIYG